MSRLWRPYLIGFLTTWSGPILTQHPDLATSPEQELQTLNTGILNVRKWLRKRHTYLTNLARSDSNKLAENAALVKTLTTEAKKQQEGVDVLLDRGQRFLAVRANIVLEVDLKNLVFLWNSYVESLRKLQPQDAPPHTPPGNRKCDLTRQNQEEVTAAVSIPYSAQDILGEPNSSKDNQTTKEDISIELKDKNSNSSGSSGSIDDSHDLSFHDSGRLTLEDLKTASSALDISELVQENTIKPVQQTPSITPVSCTSDVTLEADQDICQQFQGDEKNVAGYGAGQVEKVMLHITTESSHSESVYPDESEKGKMEFNILESCNDVIHPEDAIPNGNVNEKDLRLSSSGQCSPSLTSAEKEVMLCDALSGDTVGQGMDHPATFENQAGKAPNQVLKSEDLSTLEMKRRRGLLEAPANNISNQSSRSESPLSLDSSRSETPTGTLKRAERQNELWRAIGSIDTFLMDKDILEACKSTAGDLTSDDEDCASKPNVSFAEFLQQYSELTDWLNQVQKVTQREVTSLSEKYLNQSYQEEMLERSPRREFLNKYSRQLLRRYPGLGEQVGARMTRLNAQWAALERTVAPPVGAQNADVMLRDLESDLSTLRLWLNTIEARLLPLTIKADWTDDELEQRLHRHKLHVTTDILDSSSYISLELGGGR
ncbi:tubulin alpha-1 chain [Elysia marginata]|uniref:Tubulin alpha-1 chain n=1 Tax=Elysia marginata TaxID=1093978 RepID=A0AAV4IVQ6_9GAST|nr:tubulin alpha-1 chain [Elysia marginata]